MNLENLSPLPPSTPVAHQEHPHHRGIIIAAALLGIIVIGAAAYQIMMNRRQVVINNASVQSTAAEAAAFFNTYPSHPMTDAEKTEFLGNLKKVPTTSPATPYQQARQEFSTLKENQS